MRTLPEIAEWRSVIVYEPGQDPYGTWVVDGPAADLSARTAFLKAQLGGSYLWLPYQLASGESVEVGDAVCMGASNDQQVKRALAAALSQAGLALGIVVGEPSGMIVPVAIAGLVPAAITGLGAGSAGDLVTVDPATAKAMRGYSGVANHILGRANLGGTLTIALDFHHVPEA